MKKTLIVNECKCATTGILIDDAGKWEIYDKPFTKKDRFIKFVLNDIKATRDDVDIIIS